MQYEVPYRRAQCITQLFIKDLQSPHVVLSLSISISFFYWDPWVVRSQTYGLQLFQQGVLWAALFWRFGHVKVKAVPAAQSVQAQHERYIVLQQAGVWDGVQREIRSPCHG